MFGYNSCTICWIETKISVMATIWYKVKVFCSMVKVKFVICWKIGFAVLQSQTGRIFTYTLEGIRPYFYKTQVKIVKKSLFPFDGFSSFSFFCKCQQTLNIFGHVYTNTCFFFILPNVSKKQMLLIMSTFLPYNRHSVCLFLCCIGLMSPL